MAMEFHRAFSSYIDHVRIERGLSSNSVAAYSRDLKKFSTFLELNRIDYAQVTPSEVMQFELFLKSAKLSTSTVNRSLSALVSFYTYLQREFEISNPTQDLVRSKPPRRLPKALTVDQVTRMIDSSLRDGDPAAFRDHALLELLYSSGARVGEIVGANIADINVIRVDENEITTLKLRGKGSKERIVPLGSFAKSALDSYLIRTRPAMAQKSQGKSSQNALFINARGTRLSRQTAWSIVKKAAEETGLAETISPHVFRHSYATHLLDGGADIRVVQELLGHASVTTTQIYTLITIDKVREAYASAHPRAR